VLIEQVAGAFGAPLLKRAFGFGPAEARPVGVRLFRRLLALGAFPKSLQVDYVPHVSLHQLINPGRTKSSQRREYCRWPSADTARHSTIPANRAHAIKKYSLL
jgi:hypothetical protein